jgi:hypothetical protein
MQKVPSWKDSNSIVALSVSISARISPSLILSPTFFKPSCYRSFRHSIAQRHCYNCCHNWFIVYEVKWIVFLRILHRIVVGHQGKVTLQQMWHILELMFLLFFNDFISVSSVFLILD